MEGLAKPMISESLIESMATAVVTGAGTLAVVSMRIGKMIGGFEARMSAFQKSAETLQKTADKIDDALDEIPSLKMKLEMTSSITARNVSDIKALLQKTAYARARLDSMNGDHDKDEGE